MVIGLCRPLQFMAHLGANPQHPAVRAKPPVEGVVMSPGRWSRGSWLFRDSTLQRIAILLDEAFRIPGTQMRFGIDGIIGLVPGLGDVIGGVLSLVIPFAAWTRGVPYVTLVRMTVNIGVEVLVGVIPVFGDAFDIAWKANRRNYGLLQRHLVQPRVHTWKDWVFLLLLACGAALVFAIPLVVMAWAVTWLFRQ
jgi:hypothetical protein